jgi:glycosyltransferase involved in cell wall biosynthesis
VAKLAEARKNHRLLIRALERLGDDAAFSLTVAGSSSLAIRTPDAELVRWLRAYPRSGAIGNRVRVLEDIPFAAMGDLYASHDVCVLPSSTEPLGTAPLEAMGRGCAALVSDQCGSAWYVAGAAAAGLRCGAVFPAEDETALIEALHPILSAPERVPVLGANAVHWTRQEFAEDIFARRFLALAARLGAA